MNIIVKNNDFNTNYIFINKFNNIIYKYNDIELLGIPLKINDIEILTNYGNFYKIKCNNKNDLLLLNKINDYFCSNYKIYPFIKKDNTIFINKNNNENLINNYNFVNINIKSLRNNNKLYLYIYLL